MDWVKHSSDEFEKALDKSFRSLLSDSAIKQSTVYGGSADTEQSINTAFLGSPGKFNDVFFERDVSGNIPVGGLPDLENNTNNAFETKFNIIPKTPHLKNWQLPEVVGNATDIFQKLDVGDLTWLVDASSPAGTYYNYWRRFAHGELAINATTSSWSENDIYITYLAECENNYAQAEYITPERWISTEGSIVKGSKTGDVIRGFGGWDFIYGEAGDDLIRAGNGRDYIDGGDGGDEIHGDFGYNTYASQIDGAEDNIVIKSDTKLFNWWLSSWGNNNESQRSDIIEGLDENDKISILGCKTEDLYFHENIVHKGLTGISISVLDEETNKLTIEAHYVNNDLSLAQIKGMTTGYDNEDVMSNKLWSLNHGNTPPELKEHAVKLKWNNGEYEVY